jgi:hypothetical protein
MAFFNKKEEVIDIKLTQFGKDLLARGIFKPAFYQFFDDDVIYNSSLAGVSEHQNESESRILENTPKLKTQALTLGVESRFHVEQTLISSGERNTFTVINRAANPYVQDRILLYPLASQETSNQSAATFTMRVLGSKMEQGVDPYVTELTGSGILKSIPQINVSASFKMTEDREELFESPTMINTEAFFDLSSRETVFADGSKITVEGNPVIVDLEELNVFFGLDNFELEIYEITEKNKNKILTRIKDLEDVNGLFHIKTDSDVEEVEAKTGRKSNYYRSREN